MKPISIDLNPYSKDYLDRLARIKEIRVNHEQRKQQDVLESRWTGKGLTVPNGEAHRLYKSQRAIGDKFINPILPSESRPTSRGRGNASRDSYSRPCSPATSIRSVSSSTSQRRSHNIPLSHQTILSRQEETTHQPELTHRSSQPKHESSASRQKSVQAHLSARDHLLSMQSLDEAIAKTKFEINSSPYVPSQRSKSPSSRRSSPTPSGRLSTPVPWIPYGRGSSDVTSSKHRNVFPEGIQRASQTQQYHHQHHVQNMNIESRSPLRTSIPSSPTHRSVRSSSSTSSQHMPSSLSSSRYMSNSHIILRATLIDHTGSDIELHLSHPPKITHGILVLRQHHPSIQHLIAEITEQWHLPVDDISGESCITDLRIISTSPYTNRMHIRCLVLHTIEDQPIIEDSSCHIEVFLNQIHHDHNQMSGDMINNSISSTVNRVLVADRGSRAVSPISSHRHISTSSSSSSSYHHNILGNAQHSSYISLGQPLSHHQLDDNDQSSIISRAVSDISGHTSGIDSSTNISSSTTSIASNRYHFFSPPRENILLGVHVTDAHLDTERISSKSKVSSRMKNSDTSNISTYGHHHDVLSRNDHNHHQDNRKSSIVKNKQTSVVETPSFEDHTATLVPISSSTQSNLDLTLDNHHEYHYNSNMISSLESNHHAYDEISEYPAVTDASHNIPPTDDLSYHKPNISVATEFIPINHKICSYHHMNMKTYDDNDGDSDVCSVDEDMMTSTTNLLHSYPSDVSSHTTEEHSLFGSRSSSMHTISNTDEHQHTYMPVPVVKDKPTHQSILPIQQHDYHHSTSIKPSMSSLSWQRTVQLDLNDVLMDFD